VARFGDIAEFKNGINFSSEQKGEIGILTIDVLNMYGAGYNVTFDKLYRVNKIVNESYYLREGDILFVRSSLKREGVGWASLFISNDEPTTYCGFIIRARINESDFDKIFLTYYFRSDIARSKLISSSAKLGITNINQGNLSNVYIPKPTSPEQKKIARVLSKIQQAIETQEQIIKTTQELKIALMQKLFTEGLPASGGTEPEQQKQTEIGLIPESWEVKQLNDVANDFIGGGTPSTSKSDYWDGDIHWTTSKRLGASLYLDQGEKLITQKGLEESATHLIPKNNLLVGTRVGVGKVAILNVDMAISQDLTGVFIDINKFDAEFLAYELLSDRVQEVFAKQQRGTTIKGITREDLKYQIKLAIPEDIEIQRLVAKPLINLDMKLDLLSAELENLKNLFNSSLNQLMTGQIRVKDIEFLEIENLN
jgi:type I restriction enzyme S subunit